MRSVVLDPAAFLAWFDEDDEADLRAEYESGSLRVLVPALFDAHLLEAVARQIGDRTLLRRLADQLDHIGFVRRDPPVRLVATRVADGWPMLAAQYAALAEASGAELVAADPDLRRRSGETPAAR